MLFEPFGLEDVGGSKIMGVTFLFPELLYKPHYGGA